MNHDRRTLAFFAVAGMLALPACTRDQPTAPPTPAITAEAADDGVRLTVSLDRTELRTVDRLTLTADATAPAGVLLGALTADTPAGTPRQAERTLSVLSSAASPVRPAPEAGTARTLTLVLASPLPGDRVAPPVRLSYSIAGEDRTLTTDPIPVRVSSVLPEDDDGTLEAARGLAEPPPQPPAATAPLIIAGAVGCAALLAAAAVIVARRRVRPEPDPAAAARATLERLAAHPPADTDLAAAEHAARTLLAPVLGPRHASITAREARASATTPHATNAADILARFERARYAHASPQAVSTLLSDALAAAEARTP
jgi:hypothetical protein